MHLKIKGVSLIEIAIVIVIFGILSAGVTHLTLGLIKNQRDEETQIRENTIYNNIQDDLRNDLASAVAVYLSEASPAGYSTAFDGGYVVISACGAMPDPPYDYESPVLSILVQTSYDPAGPSTSFNLIRYKFMKVDGVPSLVRTQSNNQSVAADPGNIWPKSIFSTDPDYTPAPASFNGIAGTSTTIATIDGDPDYKMYNNPSGGSEEIAIDGLPNGDEEGGFTSPYFQVVYGEGYKPQDDNTYYPSPSVNCTYYAKHVNVMNMIIMAKGYETKYDKLFGKSQIQAPTLSFDVSPSVKFF